MTQPTGKPRKGAGRVAFLALRAEIRGLLEAGHPQKMIYEDHVQRLVISYSQFTRYVRQYLLPKADLNEHQRKNAGGISAGSSAEDPATAGAAGRSGSSAPTTSKRPTKPTPFEHDPSGNNRDDLI